VQKVLGKFLKERSHLVDLSIVAVVIKWVSGNVTYCVIHGKCLVRPSFGIFNVLLTERLSNM
jgi:hypothetical protein